MIHQINLIELADDFFLQGIEAEVHVLLELSQPALLVLAALRKLAEELVGELVLLADLTFNIVETRHVLHKLHVN